MGEAKKRRARIQAWSDGLSVEELLICQAALGLYNRFLEPSGATGMCYRMTFFLSLYLKERHGLETVVRVGYINDGTDEIYASHAWLEYNGKKIDLTLANTERPEIQLTGDMLVLDYPFNKGRANYTYHFELTQEQRAATSLASAELSCC